MDVWMGLGALILIVGALATISWLQRVLFFGHKNRDN